MARAATIDDLYRDPRTAFGGAATATRRSTIPVGQVIEGMPAAPAAPAAGGIGQPPAAAKAPKLAAVARGIGTGGRVGIASLPAIAGVVVGAMRDTSAPAAEPLPPVQDYATGNIPVNTSLKAPAAVAEASPLGVGPNNEVTRNIANTLNAVPGIGAVPGMVGKAGAAVARAVTAGQGAQQFVRGAQQAQGGELPMPSAATATGGIADNVPRQPFSDARQDAAPPAPVAAQPAMAPTEAVVQPGAAPQAGTNLAEIEARNSQLRRELDAYGPGAGGGGGAVGIGTDPAKSQRNVNFDRDVALDRLESASRLSSSSRSRDASLQAFASASGQPMPFEAQQAREQQGDLTRRGQDVTARGQDIGAMTQANALKAGADTQGRALAANRDIATMQAGTARDVATIGADGRAEIAAARAAQPKFTPIQLPDEIGEMGAVRRMGTALLNNQTGEIVNPGAQGAKQAVTPKAEYDKMPKGARYTGPDGKTYIKG